MCICTFQSGVRLKVGDSFRAITKHKAQKYCETQFAADSRDTTYNCNAEKESIFSNK